MISLKTHGVFDYLIGVVLIACPMLFGFNEIDAASRLFSILGLGLIAYSLLTRYPVSVMKWIPLGVHMTFDVLAGITLILGSYIFGYRELLTSGQLFVHYAAGLAAIALVVVTRTRRQRGVRVVDEDIETAPVELRRRSA